MPVPLQDHLEGSVSFHWLQRQCVIMKTSCGRIHDRTPLPPLASLHVRTQGMAAISARPHALIISSSFQAAHHCHRIKRMVKSFADPQICHSLIHRCTKTLTRALCCSGLQSQKGSIRLHIIAAISRRWHRATLGPWPVRQASLCKSGPVPTPTSTPAAC